MIVNTAPSPRPNANTACAATRGDQEEFLFSHGLTKEGFLTSQTPFGMTGGRFRRILLSSNTRMHYAGSVCGPVHLRLNWLTRGLPTTSQPMSKRGLLIAVEGIDGSGKQTQARLLEQSLASEGHSIYATAFPQYESWFGTMVGKFLNGEFGSLESVDPRFSALLYAGDRFEAKPRLESALNEGKIVLVDRYIASNMAHQVARAPANKRSEFLRWIEHLEYSIYGLPRENLILYLRVPPSQAQRLVAQKAERNYTQAKHDLQEKSLRHLEDAAEMYDMLSRSRPWATIQCFDAQKNSLRLLEEIAEEVLSAVRPALKAMEKA
jgi:dTMP kinase